MTGGKGRALSRYRLRTGLIRGGRVLATFLAIALTAHDLASALLPDAGWLAAISTWGLVVTAVIVGVIVGLLEVRGLRTRRYVVDPDHTLTITVDDFLEVVDRPEYANANIALGANDRFTTGNLVPGSLHQEILAKYFDPSRIGQSGVDLAKAHQAAITASLSDITPVEADRYKYGTVAVLPIADRLSDVNVEGGAARSVDRAHPRWAYLVANSTWGTHSFGASGEVPAALNPLKRIYCKHLKDGDTSRVLLVPLIGTGSSSAVSSMASIIALIDEYFDERLRARENLGEARGLDPIGNVVISLQPGTLQTGAVDLAVVHQYAAAKLKAFQKR
jgi:hypothetical protein